MARFNYYQFPDGIDANVRQENGAMNLGGECTLGKPTCLNCEVCPNGWSECEHFKCLKAETIIKGIKVSEAKRLLKKFGGSAWTDHYERSGSIFETTEINLQGNNSRFKYNRHL